LSDDGGQLVGDLVQLAALEIAGKAGADRRHRGRTKADQLAAANHKGLCFDQLRRRQKSTIGCVRRAGLNTQAIDEQGAQAMRSYIKQRPPDWTQRPDQPVIIVTGEEEKKVRENLYAFSDFWRRVRRRADDILNRNRWASRVDVCDAKGEVIRTVRREVRTEETSA
jgi:hypothetical protein